MGKIQDALRRAEELRGGVRAAPPSPASAVEPRAHSKPPNSVVLAGAESMIAEEYRTLRARLQSLRRTRSLRSLVVTSSRSGEGKTTTSANLALCFGLEREVRTCLLDCDLRTPSLHTVFGRPAAGLVEVLEGDAKLDEALLHVPNTRLSVLAVSALPKAPSELIGSRAMSELIAELHMRFSMVVIDAPPVLGLPETVTLVDLCDATLFVVGAGGAPRHDIETSLERLDAAKVIGTVLNRCDKNQIPYGSYGYGRS